MPVNAGKLVVRLVDWSTEQQRLLMIRCAVFVDEQGFPAALEIDQQDSSSWHFVAELDGMAVATARCSSAGQIGRMAVLAAYRKRGIGGALLQSMIEQAVAHSLPRLYLNAQLTARRFYSQHGFVATGPHFVDHGVEHCLMEYPMETAPP